MHNEQDDLFGSAVPIAEAPRPVEVEAKPRKKSAEKSDASAPKPRKAVLEPIEFDEDLQRIARAMPSCARLGTSSWSYPGWQGLVWAGEHSEQTLSKKGLEIYAKHPLLRTVSIDRSFYRPLSSSDYARYAAQVPEDFRFMVKAPSLITDAVVRSDDGRGKLPNEAFLSPDLAVQEFAAPALEGLGRNLGALVFQLSPLPWSQLDRMPQVIEQLGAMLHALPDLKEHAPDAVVAIEVRDTQWLAPDIAPLFAQTLREANATYCLGLHSKMPPLAEQLPLLRLLWPGPLVCRWNLHPAFGPYGYAEAEKQLSPYDRIQHPEAQLHSEFAALIRTFARHEQLVYVAISNHAEGCAPQSVRSLAEQIVG